MQIFKNFSGIDKSKHSDEKARALRSCSSMFANGAHLTLFLEKMSGGLVALTQALQMLDP